MTSQLLSHGGSLAGLSPQVRAKLLSLGQSFHYLAGETIFEKDDPGLFLYLVTSGHVNLEISLCQEGRFSLATLGVGNMFGWSVLSESHIETTSARAVDELEVLRIKGESLKDLCCRDPQVGIEIYRILAEAISACLASRHQEIVPGQPMR